MPADLVDAWTWYHFLAGVFLAGRFAVEWGQLRIVLQLVCGWEVLEVGLDVLGLPIGDPGIANSAVDVLVGLATWLAFALALRPKVSPTR